MGKNARQFKTQHYPEYVMINTAGTWSESNHTLPGEPCRIS